MAALAEYMRSAIRGGDIETAGRVLSFLEKSLRRERAIPEIANAIALSFVEANEMRSIPSIWSLGQFVAPALLKLLVDDENR